MASRKSTIIILIFTIMFILKTRTYAGGYFVCCGKIPKTEEGEPDSVFVHQIPPDGYRNTPSNVTDPSIRPIAGIHYQSTPRTSNEAAVGERNDTVSETSDYYDWRVDSLNRLVSDSSATPAAEKNTPGNARDANRELNTPKTTKGESIVGQRVHGSNDVLLHLTEANASTVDAQADVNARTVNAQVSAPQNIDKNELRGLVIAGPRLHGSNDALREIKGKGPKYLKGDFSEGEKPTDDKQNP